MNTRTFQVRLPARDFIRKIVLHWKNRIVSTLHAYSPTRVRFPFGILMELRDGFKNYWEQRSKCTRATWVSRDQYSTAGKRKVVTKRMILLADVIGFRDFVTKYNSESLTDEFTRDEFLCFNKFNSRLPSTVAAVWRKSKCDWRLRICYIGYGTFYLCGTVVVVSLV